MTVQESAAESPRLTFEGSVARIVLARPERHNALEAADIARLREHIATVDADQRVRVLVLTGSGDRTFCAGASLQQMVSGEMSADVFQTLTDDLAGVRVPTVCALNGSAFGGGVEIALCCDFRIGVTGSRVAVPAASLGICYALEGLSRYVANIGLGATRRLMIAGEEIAGEELLAVGFLDRLVQPGELVAVVDDLTARLVSVAPMAAQSMKAILRDLGRGAVDPAEARRLAEQCAASDDMREGLRARLERRPPEFHGR